MNASAGRFICSGNADSTGAVSKLSTPSNLIFFNPLTNPSQSVEG